MKKVDIMRIDNLDSNIISRKSEIFEFELYGLCRSIIKSLYQKNMDYMDSLYTLIHIKMLTYPI